jgi:hypothetical protein
MAQGSGEFPIAYIRKRKTMPEATGVCFLVFGLKRDVGISPGLVMMGWVLQPVYTSVGAPLPQTVGRPFFYSS